MFRDVSSVELLMNNHQGIKAEIDARNDSFTACIELGKALLARKHYASEEVSTLTPSCDITVLSTPSLASDICQKKKKTLEKTTEYMFVCVCVQIKEKLLQLTDKRKEMIDKWEDRWEWLRLSKTLLP